MKNIVNFCKKKYKVLIPIMVGIVLFVTIFFLYREYEYGNTRNKKEIDVFQSFAGVKTDYKAIVTYNLKDAIVNLESKNKRIEFDSVPVYYSDMKMVIFPEEMNIAFPLREGSQFKLFKYASFYKQDDVNFIKNNTDLGNYDFFFLYDGKGLFFFPDEVTLEINGKEYIKLGAMSYASIVGGLTLIYYDTTTDTGEAIELDRDTVTISSQYININMTEKYFMSFSNRVLLMAPNNLNPVFKTIDK